MIMNSIYDEKFNKYGKILEAYDFSGLLNSLEKSTPKSDNKVEYVASVAVLEELPIYDELMNRGFGGLPIQIGYCNGTNNKISRLEYHKSSEVFVYTEDVILLLGIISDIENFKYDLDKAELFRVPKGIGVEIYASTLHYAPCDAIKGKGFRAAIVLPKGTNLEKPTISRMSGEDTLMTHSNKWLLSYPESLNKEYFI